MMTCQLRYTLVAAALLFLNSGCTSTLNLVAKNTTDYPLVLSASLMDEKDSETGRIIHQEDIPSNGQTPLKNIGKFDNQKYVTVKASLRDGVLVKELVTNLQADPTTVNIEIRKDDIRTGQLRITDASEIESQLVGVKGSYETPTTDIGSLLGQYLGGIYIKNGKDGAISFERIYSPSELYGVIGRDAFMPSSEQKGGFSLSTVTDESSSAQLKTQFPDFNLNMDFSRSKLYKYLFEIQNTSWHALPYTWHSVERKLKSTQEGNDILRKLIDQQKESGDLYFLTEAFVIEDANVETYTAESLETGTDIKYANFIYAGGGYKWMKDNDGKRHIKNLALRVKYQTLSPITASKLESTEAPLKTDPNQSVEYKVITPQ
ncbi:MULTISPECIES: hypothetical protein [Methylomonas]|nr:MULTISPECIES: hypothetical protein [Methylomonas]